MRKLFIILILCVSFSSIYAADENITADSTVDGNITNNGGNVEVKGDHTLQQGDINANAGDNIVIDNDDCLKYPDKCKKDVTPTTSSVDNTATPAIDGNNNIDTLDAAPVSQSNSVTQDMTKLPKTGPADNVLILASLTIGALYIFRKRLFNI